MKFTLESNKQKLSFKKVRFNCDEPLCKSMQDLPMWHYLNKTNFAVFLGRPGSGKTTLALSILKAAKLYKQKFDNIILVMPPNSRASLEESVQLDPEKIHDELDDESIEMILDSLQAYATQNERTLLILDDVAASLKGSRYLQKRLEFLVYNMRHLKVTTFLLVQSFMSIPKNLRKNITNLFVFKLSKSEMESLGSEVLELRPRDVNDLLKLYKNPHDYMFINTATQDMYLNQDRIRILS